MAPYGIELRRRVMDAVAAGGSIREVAERFAVSPFFVKSMKRLAREQGHLRPKSGRAGRKRRLAGREEEIRGLVAVRPDLTLEQLRAELKADVCITTVANELNRLKLTFKKSPSAPPSRTAPTSAPGGTPSAPRSRRWTAAGGSSSTRPASKPT
jgi:transposase